MATVNKKTLPTFKSPAPEIWQQILNTSIRSCVIGPMLQPFEENGGFWVRGAEEEAFLAEGVVREFNSVKNARGSGLVHCFVMYGAVTEIDLSLDLLQRVLSLGTDPDLPDSRECRPSHYCPSYQHGPMIALTLAACRPDLTAEDCYARTPLYIASLLEKTGPYHGVAAVWENSLREGPPSIAKLAFYRRWWAVKNLVRRGVVPVSEMVEKFKGKDALEWAKHYGVTGMAEELEYFLQSMTMTAAQETVVDGLPGEIKTLVSDLASTSLTAALTEMEVKKRILLENVESLCKNLLARQSAAVEQLKKDVEKPLLEARKQIERKDLQVASLQAEVASLRDELAAYKKKVECSICMERESDHAFLPCGHLACENCAKAHFWSKAQPEQGSAPKCPKCMTDTMALPTRIFFD